MYYMFAIFIQLHVLYLCLYKHFREANKDYYYYCYYFYCLNRSSLYESISIIIAGSGTI